MAAPGDPTAPGHSGDPSDPDPYDLRRFVDAQGDSTFASALDELRRRRKTGHWMWFVFPQLEGLGHSPTAHHYAIRSLDEARAYLRHEVLGPRLRQCARTLLGLGPSADRTAEDIFGPVDSLKLRSSMTLFARAAPDDPTFTGVLDRYFDGRPDPLTEQLLARAPR